MMYASDRRNEILPYAFGNELEWLRGISKECNQAAMIGAGPGVMAMAVKEGNPFIKLTIVDIKTCHYAREHLKFSGYTDVKYVVEDSAIYGKTYQEHPIDLLIVDGDHTFEGVVADIVAWNKHVKSGGVIFFHDYVNINDDETNGVEKAVLHLLDSGILDAVKIDRPGVSIVFRKN
jgi:hypothetical protein